MPLSNYTIWQILLFELAHGILSLSVGLLVSLLAYLSMRTIYRYGYSAYVPGSSRLLSPVRSERAVICMVLLSFSAGLVAHVLEDIWFSWF